MSYQLLKNFLFKFEPETAHSIVCNAVKFIPEFILKSLYPSKQNEPVQVMGLDFPNPVGLAAGLDKNGEYINSWDALGFGFIEIGTVTPQPQPGNAKPRLFRLPQQHALINRMGFNNYGVEYAIQQVNQSRFKGILGINIGKNASTPLNQAINDYIFCLGKVYPHADYVTVNVSSPNTVGLRNLQHGEFFDRLLSALKIEQTRLSDLYGFYTPIAIKIAPDLTSDELDSITLTLIKHKIDAVIATNTTNARIGSGVEYSKYADQQGGLSGAPLTKISTDVILHLAKILQGQIPIIASGGIMSGDDAADKISAGASLVQLYTGLIYRGPRLINESINAIKVLNERTNT